jgi:8-oxo-dGTP pyrophosphatase MutT (NUDIX family)
LTVRPKHLPDHPGQISLPGGRLEQGESRQDAAMREFAEEMGVPLEGEIIGTLQPVYVFNSNYFVHPFLAISDRSLCYRPCRYEVARIIHLPIKRLIDPSLLSFADFHRGLVQWRAKAIRYGADQVWGATAVILGELSAVLEGIPWPQTDSDKRPVLGDNASVFDIPGGE